MNNITEETTVRTAAEWLAEAESQAKEVNGLYFKDGVTPDETAKALDKLADTMKKLNERAKTETYAEWRKTETPMLTAITNLEYPCYSITATKVKDSTYVMRTIRAGTKIVDLVDFQKFCAPAQIAKELGWQYFAEHVALLISASLSKDLDADTKTLLDKYSLSKGAKGLVTQEAVPTSNTQLTKLLQKLVDKIFFVDNGSGLNAFKVTSQDLAFIKATVFGKGGKACTVKAARSQELINRVTQIMWRNLSKVDYALMYRENK